MVKRLFLQVFILSFFLISNESYGLSIARLSIEDLTNEASCIFLGEVKSVEEGKSLDGKRLALVTRFKVEERFKGCDSSEQVVRQVARRFRGKVLPLYHGQSKFEVGQKLVVFLHGESRVGFSSPVGMGQGVFKVHGLGKSASNSLRLTNQYFNRGLFQQIQTHQTQQVIQRVLVQDNQVQGERLTVNSLREIIRSIRGL